MKKSRIMKKVVLVVAMLFVIITISPAFNVEYAALNTNKAIQFGGDGKANKVIGDILSIGLGSLGSALSSVILLVVGLLALILSSIFGPLAGTWGFPGIDQIVFNGVAIFDPNFISPPPSDLVSFSGLTAVRNLIASVYQTGYVVGGSIFVIGAMIIGIKLAITSIASEKAYYKELIGKWIKGLVLLFTVHIIITGVFMLNELVVQKIYDASRVDKLTFTVEYSLPGTVGKAISAVIKFFSGLFPGGSSSVFFTYSGEGITGLTIGLVIKGVMDGDLISAIAAAGLLGQTASLMITYLKRVIVCILLAAIAPYIVAVDFIKQLL